MFIPLIDRILLDEKTGCWNWRGTTRGGYGRTWFRGKRIGAHRLSAYLWLGLDPADKRQALHRCDNPLCFNPKHLFIGTPLENMRDSRDKGRMWQGKKTHCPQGHPYSGENLYLYGKHRQCRECTKNACLRYYRKRRASMNLGM